MTPSRKRLPRSYTEKARRDHGSKKTSITALTGSWDRNIPSDILYEILSRLGLKDFIQASAVCKTWLETAVSVRNLVPRPLLFYPQRESDDDGDYILLDPSRSATYKLNLPDLMGTRFYYSRDGWLLVSKKSPSDLIFFLNPFTRERIYLPKGSCYSENYCLAFSAAPTSTSCFVISLNCTGFHTQLPRKAYSVINTWQLGETVWTTHHLEHPLPSYFWGDYYLWEKILFSNGIFYCLSTSGRRLGVFDPSRENWNIHQVERFPDGFVWPKLMTEHEGDIFVIYRRYRNNNSAVFKLNLKRKAWEEKTEVGGLAAFASYHASLPLDETMMGKEIIHKIMNDFA